MNENLVNRWRRRGYGKIYIRTEAGQVGNADLAAIEILLRLNGLRFLESLRMGINVYELTASPLFYLPAPTRWDA